jgi:hypothetical protein
MQNTLKRTENVKLIKSLILKLCGPTEGTNKDGRSKNIDRLEEKQWENELKELKEIWRQWE